MILFSCQKNNVNPNHRIDYSEGQQAFQIAFDGNGSLKEYSVRLKGSENPVLGKFFEENGSLVFRPIVPFSWDQEYEIYKKDQFYLEFIVRTPEKVIRPKLLGIYPKLDTVPENLLKMYFEFDSPMQQSRSSLDFIKVFNLTKKEEVAIFLPLENELWNLEKTRLTLWLDPGRIKKDLIPNQEKGIPIEAGNQYELIVERHFSGGTYGADLGKSYTKRFYVSQRDRQRSNVNQWKLTIPKSNSKEGLGIEFDEFLDVILANESIAIVDENKQEISGDFLTSKKGSNTLFVPSNPWEKGSYRLIIDSKLEDLAGNNLNRLFDEDLQNRGEVNNSKFKVLKFVIE
jgi:hypothetical protein